MKPVIHQSRTHLSLVLMLVLTVLIVLSGSTVFAIPYFINVDTSIYSGTDAQLAFDLISGGDPSSNTVTISGFSATGTLGADGLNRGNASGSLPGTITLSTAGLSFFNEYLKNITLGSKFSFLLDATTNGSGSAFSPDAFSLFILDPSSSSTLYSTTDPTGADALLLLNIDGSSNGDLSVYDATVSATPVPEPGTAVLLSAGFLLFFLRLKRESIS